MKSLDPFFQSEIVHALGWTILHSIWQGLLIVVLLTVALVILRKQSSRVRYLVGYLALLSLALSSLATFILSLPSAMMSTTSAGTVASAGSGLTALSALPLSQTTPAPVMEETYWQSFVYFLESNLPWITIVWMAGVLILSLRFLAELAYIQRLKHQPGGKIKGSYQDLVNQMASTMGIQKFIELKENLRIDGPMVIGFVKPVILVPIGLLSRLDAAQVESILAHELAHIKRHDYLFNLLQSLVEIVLFFNPATWWISALIRSEREHSCDEMAIAQTGDQMVFVQTLAKLEEYRRFPNNMALAFNGRRQAGVLGRIQRIVNSEGQFRLPYKLFWSAIILLSSLGLFAFQGRPIPNQEMASVMEQQTVEQDKEASENSIKAIPEKKEDQSLAIETDQPSIPESDPGRQESQSANITKENTYHSALREGNNSIDLDTVPDKIKQLRRQMFELEKGFREQEMALHEQNRTIQRQMLQLERELQAMENEQMKDFYELEKKNQQLQFDGKMKLKELELEHNTIESNMMELQYEVQEYEAQMRNAENKEELTKKRSEALLQIRELQKRKKEIELSDQRNQVELEKEMQLLQNQQWQLKEELKIKQNEKRLQKLELEQQLQELQFKNQMVESEQQSKLQLLQMQLQEEMMKWEERQER